MRYLAQGELDLGTIKLLDKVQKGQRIEADNAKRLKAAQLVDGRYPNLLVAGSMAGEAPIKERARREGINLESQSKVHKFYRSRKRSKNCAGESISTALVCSHVF